ncbi:MAG: HAD family phosphatase [Aminivibrio sp.]|mgnify:FL=1|jgi:Cof subfamily protein (haloacid dehalogenase superfamily)|nr:HAD family phosphatase [Aminivibrio sp.]
MAFKLLVTDIDETLSRGESVSPEVERACVRLRENGWSLMVATGRILATAITHIRGIGSSLPAIVYDGGRVMDPSSGRALCEIPMDPGLALEIVEAGWNHPVELQIIGDERAFCRYSDVMTRDFFAASGVPVDDTMESPSSPSRVYRVIFHGVPGCIRTLQYELKKRFSERAEVVQAGEGFLDILPRGVSKGAALASWIDTLPERPDLVVAAGDHHNDMELLAMAQISAAPEDAADDVLKIARVIMPSADRHGFAALADWLLEWEKSRYEISSPVVLL